MNATEIKKFIDARGRINHSIKKITNLTYQELYCILYNLDYEFYKNLAFISFNKGHSMNFKKDVYIDDYLDIIKYKIVILTKNGKLETNKLKNIKFKSKEIYDIFYGSGICQHCGAKTSFITFNKGYKLCCETCNRHFGGKEALKKSIVTNTSKYGVFHPMQNTEIKLKKVSNCDYSTMNDKIKSTCIKKYGDIYQRTNIFSETREKTCIERYGVANPLLLVKEANLLNGKWTSDDMLSDKELYYRMVNRCQQKFVREIELLPNFEKRGNHPSGFHIDHIYSKHMGFHNNILPYYIGHICNLEMLLGSINMSKNSSCNISIEELYNKVAGYNAVLNRNI